MSLEGIAIVFVCAFLSLTFRQCGGKLCVLRLDPDIDGGHRWVLPYPKEIRCTCARFIYQYSNMPSSCLSKYPDVFYIEDLQTLIDKKDVKELRRMMGCDYMHGTSTNAPISQTTEIPPGVTTFGSTNEPNSQTTEAQPGGSVNDCPLNLTHHTLDQPDAWFHEYVWPKIPTGVTSFYFKLRAAREALVGLSTTDEDVPGMYSILLGGWDNMRSEIRNGKGNSVFPDNTFETPNILNEAEYRRFYISFTDDLIQVAKNGTSPPLMSYLRTEGYNITHIGIATYWGNDGDWVFCGFGEPEGKQYLKFK
ncbi:uncharacterized protein [Amphiura filiformis]|uniref:uncharacterized protein n=1 Tax=Amphiura filiformis TaxID=82378 RepID=UPI003B220271